jgi:hypothetical protein
MRVRGALVALPVLLLGCGGENTPAGPCEDDPLGNTTQARSHELMGSADLPGLKLCPGSEDWFRLDATLASSLGVSACGDSNDEVALDFAAFREEFGELYRHTNCGSSGGGQYCTGTCLIESPGIYYFRVSAPAPVRYGFSATVTPRQNNLTQSPPGFDMAVVLQPDIPNELTVCAPQATWMQLQIAAPSLIAIASTMTYAGYYLDFTLTAENGAHVAYWPQGAGKTRHEQALDPGRYMLRMRSALSGCRVFTLSYGLVAR